MDKFTTLRKDRANNVNYGWCIESGWEEISIERLADNLYRRIEDWNHKLYDGGNVSEWHYEGYPLPLDTPKQF